MFWKKEKSEIEKVYKMYGNENAADILKFFYTAVVRNNERQNGDAVLNEDVCFKGMHLFGRQFQLMGNFYIYNKNNKQLIFELEQQNEKYYDRSLANYLFPLTAAELGRISDSLKALEEQDPIKKLLDVVKEDGFWDDFHWEKR